MPFRDDGQASTQTISMLVAGVVFLSAIAAVLLTSQDSNRDRASADGAAQDVEAGSLADILLGSPGVGWALGADGITRLGLGAGNGSGLDPASIEALKGAMATSEANGKVDYPDAQQSLGMDPDGTADFHIRMYPVGMDTVYDASLSGIRIAYISDFTSLPDIVIPLGTPPSEYVPQANIMFNASMGPNTVLERQALRELGLDFNDRVYIGETPEVEIDVLLGSNLVLLDELGVESVEGDVYPDIKAYLSANLIDRLDGYDILVVGSGVMHSTLTDNHVKEGISDWVTEDGGTLVVLGSDAMAYQWLQPLFHTGVSTVNGAAMAPDVSHPLLKEPNELSWTSYDNHGKGWDIKDQGSGAHYDDFSHVIVQGGEDVLAISKDGAFGEGRIILTTYLPREIASSMGLAEAMGLIENIVLFADHTNLYLEYGAQVPAGMAVSVGVRQSWLWDETLGQVPVRLEVQTWG
jgi:hypothetical protein